MTLFDGPGAATDQPDDVQGELRTPAGLQALQALPGIGRARSIALARRFPTTAALRAASPHELQKLAGRTATVEVMARLVVRPARPQPRVRLVGYFDSDYPTALRDIDDPPAVLWVIGTLPPPAVVAIVGTRHPMPWGVTVARNASESAVDAGFGVISGLAMGIDAIAHQAALDAGGRSWAVLGNDVNEPSPAMNRALAARLVDQGGGLIAEVPPGTKPSAQSLIARDRLQSGLSLATIVAQSGIPGGTLHTARFAIQQSRLLVVAKPSGSSASDPAFAGNMALTDTAGCSPEILRAKGSTAEAIRHRKPVADVVIQLRDDLAPVWEGLSGAVQPRPPDDSPPRPSVRDSR